MGLLLKRTPASSSTRIRCSILPSNCAAGTSAGAHPHGRVGATGIEIDAYALSYALIHERGVITNR